MYAHILVALDGSSEAEQVLPHVQELASRLGSRVTLLRATLAPEVLIAETAVGAPSMPESAAFIDPAPVLEAEHAAAREYVEQVAGRLKAAELNVGVELPEGPAGKVIIERAAELGVDVIAMTTHGRSGLGRVVFGSVADTVLRHATCPILLVRVREK
jgi:nucleotide-binding universal stress UspA family protein